MAVASALLLTTVALAPAAASANSVPADVTVPSLDQLKAADAKLASYGVAKADRTALLVKAKSGQPWESVGGKPVSVEGAIEDGYRTKLYRFSDGSVVKTGVQEGQEATAEELAIMVAEAAPYVNGSRVPGKPIRVENGGLIQPRGTGFRGCTYGQSAGVFYGSNCHVYYEGISWSSAFKANYQRWRGGSGAQYVNGTRYTIAWTLTVDNEAVHSMQSGTRIQYSMNLHPARWGNIPFFLDFKVTSTSAYATYGP